MQEQLIPKFLCVFADFCTVNFGESKIISDLSMM